MNSSELVNALNNNPGVLSVALFLVALVLGWVTGIFKSLRRKPRLRIQVLESGPSFFCVIGTGRKYNGNECHRTCAALYLKITNIGLSSTSIEEVTVAYRRSFSSYPFVDWFFYRIRWYFLEQNIVLDDFRIVFGKSKNEKVFPMLFQRSSVTGETAKTFLSPGESTNGVVYLEGDVHWGIWYPRARRRNSRIRIVINDSFNRQYRKITSLPFVVLSEAQRYNSKFGTTRAEFDEKEVQIEINMDSDGNLLFPKNNEKEDR